MRGRWVVRLFGIALIILIVFAGFGQAVLHLWNTVMPGVFGLHTITYWQAMGLLGLSWILFGGLRGWFPAFGRYGRHRRWARWEQMTPEEREKFRQGMRGRCGNFGPPAAEPKS